MCGIVGIVDPGGRVEVDTIVRMRDTLIHRGPDDAGVWISPDRRAGLGHRRLSILDLSERGRQPMSDPGGRACLVYNGEVYNFRQLRQELEREGFRFLSDTDTEVILHACLAWGIGAVERLEGMFAFALHDGLHHTTYLVRDRLGIKPLFYSLTGGRLIFASEMRAILASGLVSRDLSPEAAYDYFSYGYVPTPHSIYRGIMKLPPGSILTYRGGRGEVGQYWRPQFECLGDDPETAARKLRGHVDASVRAHLVSDVPVGSYLSGGLDSTIVTQQAALAYQAPTAAGDRLGGSELHTFSIGFDVAEHTELKYARAAAASYGTIHTEQMVTREMAHEFDAAVVGLFDEPFAASSSIPMLFVARLARQKVTVALCGEGGDEAFGGYRWYRSWLKFRRPSFWRCRAGQRTRRVLETLIRRPKRRWRLPALESVDLYAELMGAVTAADKREIFCTDLLAAVGGRDNAAYFRRWWREELPPLPRMQYVDMMTFLPDLNLTRADRTSMHFSLELRVPLLDHRLVEYVCGLNHTVRNPGGQLKGLYKRAMWQRLPEPIRHRRKKGFSAPVRNWFTAEDLAGLVRRVRAERRELAGSWLSGDLERTVRRFRGSRAYKLWVFLQWLRRHA
jgi:asparagine synthase (glutamine-hydrolysing)